MPRFALAYRPSDPLERKETNLGVSDVKPKRVWGVFLVSEARRRRMGPCPPPHAPHTPGGRRRGGDAHGGGCPRPLRGSRPALRVRQALLPSQNPGAAHPGLTGAPGPGRGLPRGPRLAGRRRRRPPPRLGPRRGRSRLRGGAVPGPVAASAARRGAERCGRGVMEPWALAARVPARSAR